MQWLVLALQDRLFAQTFKNTQNACWRCTEAQEKPHLQYIFRIKENSELHAVRSMWLETPCRMGEWNSPAFKSTLTSKTGFYAIAHGSSLANENERRTAATHSAAQPVDLGSRGLWVGCRRPWRSAEQTAHLCRPGAAWTWGNRLRPSSSLHPAPTLTP